MRHYVGTTLIVALSVVFTGCGKNESAPRSEQDPSSGAAAAETSLQDQADHDSTVLTIWWAQWDPAVGLQELGNDFEKKTGIKVNVRQIPWGKYQEQVFLEFGNKKTSFDIVVGDSQWLGKGATEGLYVDLTDWLPTVTDIDKIQPQARKYLCEYPAGSGRFFAAPCETDACGFAYRKDWFESEEERKAFKARYNRDLGVPDTWDEFVEVAEFFTRPDEQRYGCVLLTGRSYDALVMGFQQVMWSFGGSWGDPDTHEVEGHVNSSASADALNFFKSLLQYTPQGGGNIDYDRILESYKDTKSAAMLMTYFAFFPAIEGSDIGANTGYFVMPSKDGKRCVSLGGQGFSISAKTSTQRQTVAKKFIAWFLERETQEQWITKPGGFTAHTDVLASEAFRSATGYNAAFADSLDHMQDFWNLPQYNELLSIAMSHLGEALDNDTVTAKQALDRIAEEQTEVLQDAGLL
jgi:multiple sugar transport system substrate-binding protein